MSYSDIQLERDIKINMSDMTKSEYDNEEIVEYLEEPIQLIEFQGSKFKLNPEALKIINSIENDVIVVSIVGKARTGKSYLMNLLLDRVGKEQGVFKYLINSFKFNHQQIHARKEYGYGEVLVNQDLATMQRLFSWILKELHPSMLAREPMIPEYLRW
jgi:hypothetical protein